MAVVERVEAGSDGRRRLRLKNPASLALLGEIEVCDAEDVRAAVERARKAQPEWAASSFEERSRYVERAVRILLDRQDEFLDRIVAETGKPAAEALTTELVTACDAMQFYAKRAKRILSDRVLPLHLLKTKKLRIVYRPMGVVGIITPWNFPFLLSLNPTVQALMAGNAVVLKPSEVTPLSGRLVGDLFEAAGLPEGVLSVVLGDGETGAALLESGVDKISFTGSVETGRRVAEICGRNLVPCTLELGGKDPMIVCADADLDRAARGAVFGAFSNSGQVCTSTERVYVVEDVADEFTRKVVKETAALRQGAEGEFDIGAIIRPEQLDVIEAHVGDALERGARLLAGGRRNPDQPGYFYEPTVLTDVTHDMRVMRDETFGPVLPIMRVRDEDEALALANDSRYGLNANVWTKNKRRGARLARALDTGCAVVNDCMVTYGVTESPFGGTKESGIGRVNGDLGLKGFCHTKSIVVDRLGGKSEPTWFPYTARKARTFKRVMRVVWEAHWVVSFRETRAAEKSMISSILVATDGSEAAVAAERFGASLAGRMKARLMGVSVVEDRLARGFTEDGLGVAPPSPEALATYLRARAEAACRRLSERAAAEGVEHTCATSDGIADDRIVEKGQGADLIVVGRDGNDAAYRTGLIGGTANGVIRKSAKAALVVPAGAQLSGPLVLAFDGSPGSRIGANAAVQLATRLGEPIHVFVDSKDKGRAVARFEEVRGIVGSLPVPVREISSTLGRPDVKIVDSAREVRAGLIVMGAYGRNRITDYFLGKQFGSGRANLTGRSSARTLT